MIHRDLCNPTNTKDYSPLRMQFHFLLSRYVCWNGYIPLTRKEMASLLHCNIQSIQKFIKKGVREGILTLQADRLFLLKRVVDYSQGYVKHFQFLESKKFTSLNVHAQRFILYTLWAGVHTGRPLKREISTLYHSNRELNGVLNLYSRAPIYAVLEEAKTFLDLEIIIQNEKEVVRVNGLCEPYSKQQALENEGEMKLLTLTLEAHSCDHLLSESSCQEILKIKKHYFEKLQSTGMELFSHGLQKLMSLHKLPELNNRNEIGSYFRSILNDLEQKIVPTLQKQIKYIEQSILHSQNPSFPMNYQVIKNFQLKLDRLSQVLKLLHRPTKKSYNVRSFPFFNWLEMN